MGGVFNDQRLIDSKFKPNFIDIERKSQYLGSFRQED